MTAEEINKLSANSVLTIHRNLCTLDALVSRLIKENIELQAKIVTLQPKTTEEKKEK